MDPATITGVLAAGSHVVNLLKTAAEALKKSGKPEAVGSIVEIQVAMMDLLQKQHALIDENRQFRERVRDLEDSLAIKDTLEYHHSAYWRSTAEGLDGPFSPTQWELERRLVRMRRYGRQQYEDGEKLHFYEPNSKDSAYVPMTYMQEKKALVLKDEAPQ